MTKESLPHEGLPFGLLELDAVGTVLYYNDDGHPGGGARDVVGRNFFTEVVTGEQAEELRLIIKSFWESHAPSRNLTLNVEGYGQPCKVLLARVHEQTDGWGKDSILVRFRKD